MTFVSLLPSTTSISIHAIHDSKTAHRPRRLEHAYSSSVSSVISITLNLVFILSKLMRYEIKDDNIETQAQSHVSP